MSSVDASLVVAGAGAAGCAAALAAAKAGLDVVIVEASPTFPRGSNTSMSTSMVPAGGSQWQEAAGIDDSPEQFLADVVAKTDGTADREIATALTEVAPDLVAWLADEVKVPFDLVTDFNYPGHSRLRCHSVPDRSGATMHRHLLDGIAVHEAAGTITFMSPMRLADLHLDDDRVSAVELETPAGNREHVSCGAVALCTSGFAAEPSLVARFIDEMSEAVYHGGDGATGDAVRLAEALDLDVAYLDAYQGHGSLAVPHGILLTWAFVMHGGILVNADGHRFGDETRGYSEFGPLVANQPGGEAFAVFDERIAEKLTPFKDYLDVVDSGAVRWIDDEVALAAAIGAPSASVAATLQSVRAAAAAGADHFGRSAWGSPPEPPFAVVKVAGALFHTQGGLHVDRFARVRRSGRPMANLYAAGGAAAGMSGHGAGGYMAGNGLLAALGLGFLAGRHAGTAAQV